jgi:hypothetical protein
MAADVVELVDRSGEDMARRWRTYKAFLGDVCRGQSTWDFAAVDDHP